MRLIATARRGAAAQSIAGCVASLTVMCHLPWKGWRFARRRRRCVLVMLAACAVNRSVRHPARTRSDSFFLTAWRRFQTGHTVRKRPDIDGLAGVDEDVYAPSSASVDFGVALTALMHAASLPPTGSAESLGIGGIW